MSDLTLLCAAKRTSIVRSKVHALEATTMEIGLRPDDELEARRRDAALIKPLSMWNKHPQKGDNALSGTRDRDGPDRHQWPAFDVRVGHRLVTAGAAGGTRRKER